MTLAPRVVHANRAGVRAKGEYVLYWMIAARRTAWSFALDHALARCRELGRPLLVLEPLRAGYPWACDRFHAFVLQGMHDNARAFAKAGVAYHPYVEPEPGTGSGLVEALAARAAVVITDEQPGFFLPRMVASLAARVDVAVETVDGNGLLPLRAFDKPYPTAASFRRQIQKIAPPYLAERPHGTPLANLPKAALAASIPAAIARRWPAASAALLAAEPAALAALPIEHGIAKVSYPGGAAAAELALAAFVEHGLPRYADGHNHPDSTSSSGLSPYLHFGHISAHEVAWRALAADDWDLARLAGAKVTGSREGWWSAPANTEAFLDELVTWRELGYGFCFHRKDFGEWSALPAWAQKTLEEHASDPRPELYTRAELDEARTGDPIWNAAQHQLRAEGRIHNYLRMLWGKKILEWSKTPRAALSTLIELNNKYAVDGRDPNSYTGILWTLGLFDRPWGPIRPIFGTIRYMSSASTVKKLHMKQYLARWSVPRGQMSLL